MKRLERLESIPETLLAALQGFQSELWTALPGIIQSFSPSAMTAVVQPAIRAKINKPAFFSYQSPSKIDDQSKEFCWDQLPLLLDCPVIFPNGGGVTLTFPVATGDECLVIFASRCIDAWWQSGGIQNQAALRMHNLSDGFVLVGAKSQPKVLSNVSTTAAQLRSNDGSAYVQLNPTSHEIDIVTPGTVNITATGNITVTSSANVSVNAVSASVTASSSAAVTAPSITLGAASQSLLAFVTSAFQSLFNGHVHTNGNGGANTGAPTSSMGAGHLTTTVKGG